MSTRCDEDLFIASLTVADIRRSITENLGGKKCEALDIVCVRSRAGRHIMRTNIVIDDALMAEVRGTTGAKTKREAVELGLKTLLRLRRQGEHPASPEQTELDR